jgi:type I restriction enzyme S subunit
LNLASFAAGAAIPHIYFRDYGKCEVSVPPLDEQQRIVAELDLLTEVIDKQNAQLKELDTLAQSIFYDMFGDPIENEKGWDIRPLERVVDATCTLSYGIVQTGDDVEDGVPVVRPIDMYSTYVTSLGLKKTTKEISDSYKRTILKGSELLLCIRGATGIVAMASIDLKGCNVGRNIVPISFSSCVIRDFAYYVFKTKSMFQEIQNKTHGIALQGINVKDVRLLPIILPPLALQQEFADKIQSIEKQKAAVNQSIAETQKLLDYTMDKYFG